MSERVCSLCGKKPVRSDNETGICYLCQQKRGGVVRLCACGCGKPIGRHSAGGVRAVCRLRVATKPAPA